VDAIEAADRIRAGKLRTGTYDVCLDESLVEAYEHLLEQRDAQREETRNSLAGGATSELDGQIDQLVEQMRDATLTLKFQALSRPRFRTLVDAYPPRTKEDGSLSHREDVVGVNVDAFYERIIPLSLVEPKLDDDSLKLLLEEHLTDRQYQELTDVIWNLNRGKVDLPFSSAASTTARSSSPR
jgi:hypothetical protein